MTYDAFISYRHGGDAAVATAVEHGLERIAKPWNRLRAMSVFRDQSDLGAEADLSAAITRTLDDTRFFVLIASPESASSPWVDKEVAYWCDERNGAQQLIVILADGELAWDESAGSLTAVSTAVSPAVRSRITTEPLYIDLRWARDVADLSLHDSRFRSAMVLAAATIRGVAPADLESEDVRLHRRARRLARAALATMAVLAVAASIAAVLAVSNARRAEQRARDALGRQLGLVALDMPASEADQAFLLSLVAAELDSDGGVQRFQAARALIGRYSRLEKLLRAPPATTSLRSVAISADGARVVATITDGGTATLLSWPETARSGPATTALTATVGTAPDVWFLDGGRMLVGSTDAGFVTVDDDSGAVELPGALAVDPAAGIAALSTPAGAIELVSLATGESLASTAVDTLTGVDVRFARAVAAAGANLVLLDASDGSSARVELESIDGVTALAAGPSDAVAAVTASSDRRVVTWQRDGDRLTVRRAMMAPGEVGRPERLVVAADGRRVLVVGSEGSAVFAVESGEFEAIDAGATGAVAIDPTGRYAAVGGARLTIWDLEAGSATLAVPQPVNAMAWSGCDEGSACTLATVGQSLDVWNPASRRHIELLGQTNAQTVAISADGASVVTGGWGANAAVWQLRPIVDDTARVAIDPHEAMQLPGGTRRIEWSGGAPVISVVATGERIDVDRRCTGQLHATSPLGEYVVLHATDRTTAVCSTQDGALVAWARLGGAASPADAVAVDDHGNVALGGGSGYVAHFPREASGFVEGSAIDVRLGGAPVDFTSLVVRDGTIAAGIKPPAVSAQARVLVWPYATSGTPTQFDADFRAVPAVALIGSDTEYVVTAGSDTDSGAVVLQIWEAATSRRLGRALAGLSGEVLALHGSDAAVEAADSDGNAFRWALDQDPTRDVCGIVGRPLAQEEWRDLAGGALARFDYEPVCP